MVPYTTMTLMLRVVAGNASTNGDVGDVMTNMW